MPGMNLDAAQSALTPYTITVQGQTYTAKELTYLEARALRAQMQALQDDDEAVSRAMLAALDLPADLILGAFSQSVVEALIEDFFAHYRTRNRPT